MGKTRVWNRSDVSPPNVEDLGEQIWAAWQILVKCAGPRCHHLLRTLPPSQFSEYALRHDAGMLRTMKSLLGGLPGEPQEKEDACRLATLPMRIGLLGLRSATPMAPSWADALHMVQERLPALAQSIVVQLEAATELVGCLSDLRAAGNTLDRHGFEGATSMAGIAGGHPSTSRH